MSGILTITIIDPNNTIIRRVICDLQKHFGSISNSSMLTICWYCCGNVPKVYRIAPRDYDWKPWRYHRKCWRTISDVAYNDDQGTIFPPLWSGTLDEPDSPDDLLWGTRNEIREATQNLLLRLQEEYA